MYAVNTLIQDAYESIGMTGIGSETGGTESEVGLKELNRVITALNAQGFLAMSQKWVDAQPQRIIKFHRLATGEAADGSIDMDPPVRVEAVARKLGMRFIPLKPTNHMQMSMKNPLTMAYGFTYDTDIEEGPDGPRNVGVVTLDGEPHGEVRIWYNGHIPHYNLNDTIYLSDLYNELLLSGLALNLANYFELSPEKKDSCKDAFTVAKSLIKAPNAQQRMGQCGPVGTSWNDPYYNGLSGYGM